MEIEGLPGKPQYGAVMRRVHGVTYQTAHRQEINQNALDCNRPYNTYSSNTDAINLI